MLNDRFEEAWRNQHYWVTGECKNPIKQSGDHWSFDLVCREGSLESGEQLSIIQCRIWSDQADKIDADLQSNGTSLAAALVDGMNLEVSGRTNFWSGSLQLLITSIRPGFQRTGSLYLEQIRNLADFATSHPKHRRAQSPREQVHFRIDQGVPLPAETLRAVTTVSPRISQGKNDFQFERSAKVKTVHYEHIDWYRTDAISRFDQILHKARLKGHGMVILARGGGHWSGMRAFDSRELAEIIVCADIPVVTAVGHVDNILLADRAAVASFSTPSAIAAAINVTFKHSASASFKKLDQLRRMEQHEQNVQTEAQLTRLTTELIETRKRVATLCQDATERKNQHIQTLLAMAKRRVRGYSRLATGLVTLLAVWMFFGAHGWLGFFGIEPTFTAVFATRLTVPAAAWVTTWKLESDREKISQPALKPMSDPPTTAQWLAAIQKVKTVRRLRKLQRHLPVSV